MNSGSLLFGEGRKLPFPELGGHKYSEIWHRFTAKSEQIDAPAVVYCGDQMIVFSLLLPTPLGINQSQGGMDFSVPSFIP